MSSTEVDTKKTKPIIPVKPQTLFLAKSITWLAYIGMIAILTWVNVSEESGSLVRWVIQTLALWIVFPGMIRQKYRAYSWLCFIIVMYFIPSVMKVMAPQGDWTDSLMLALCVIIFIVGAYTSRWMQRAPFKTDSN